MKSQLCHLRLNYILQVAHFMPNLKDVAFLFSYLPYQIAYKIRQPPHRVDVNVNKFQII